MKKLGFSLSGGGLSSVAYLGFFDELRENGIEASYYAGLSGGALISVLLASGLSSQEITDILLSLKPWKFINLRWHHLELLDHTKFIDTLREKLPIKEFEKLPTPAFIFTTNLKTDEPEIIDSGDIASAVVASCSVFPVMQPVKRKGMILTDGGYTIYYGAQYLRDKGAKKVIGVDVSGLTEGSLKGWMRYFYRPQNASITSNARYELHEHPVDLDVQIMFPTPTIFTFRKKIPTLLRMGRQAAQKNLKAIKKLAS